MQCTRLYIAQSSLPPFRAGLELSVYYIVNDGVCFYKGLHTFCWLYGNYIVYLIFFIHGLQIPSFLILTNIKIYYLLRNILNATSRDKYHGSYTEEYSVVFHCISNFSSQSFSFRATSFDVINNNFDQSRTIYQLLLILRKKK